MTILNQILYNSGDVFLPKSVRDFLEKGWYPGDTETFYLNGWTGIHFLSGINVGIIYLRWIGVDDSLKTEKELRRKYYWNLFIIHTMWEAWQVFIGMAKPWKLTGASNFIDSIVDTVFFMAGCYLAINY